MIYAGESFRPRLLGLQGERKDERVPLAWLQCLGDSKLRMQ